MTMVVSMTMVVDGELARVAAASSIDHPFVWPRKHENTP